jgi:release factor glutamine methyltransferase
MSTSDQPWTIGRLLSWTTEFLERHGAENPRLDAEVLLAAARGCRRIDLYVAFDEEPSEEVRTAFRELVRRRADGTPVAYLVGKREFYSLEFEVTPDVLIPRPETELLVVALLDYVKQRHSSSIQHPASSIQTIADVGTGSGVLAVCAAKYVPTAHVTAIDISPAALAVARRNAERHGVAGQINFVESDLFANIPPDERFDAIVSNPPYVSTAEMPALPADVREH